MEHIQVGRRRSYDPVRKYLIGEATRRAPSRILKAMFSTETLLRDESITTFFAGHETTARTMTFAWYALAANPKVTDRLHEELDRVLGGRPPTVDALRRLPYTLQVVKEVLRLYPAAAA